jgi:hypothetical protein
VKETTNWGRPHFIFPGQYLNGVIEGLDEVLGPLLLFHKIAKRAVQPLAVFIARYRLWSPGRCFWDDHSDLTLERPLISLVAHQQPDNLLASINYRLRWKGHAMDVLSWKRTNPPLGIAFQIQATVRRMRPPQRSWPRHRAQGRGKPVREGGNFRCKRWVRNLCTKGRFYWAAERSKHPLRKRRAVSVSPRFTRPSE